MCWISSLELGMATEVSSAEGTIVYQYDDHGYLISVENARGDVVKNTYDEYGSKPSMSYPDGLLSTMPMTHWASLPASCNPQVSASSIITIRFGIWPGRPSPAWTEKRLPFPWATTRSTNWLRWQTAGTGLPIPTIRMAPLCKKCCPAAPTAGWRTPIPTTPLTSLLSISAMTGIGSSLRGDLLHIWILQRRPHVFLGWFLLACCFNQCRTQRYYRKQRLFFCNRWLISKKGTESWKKRIEFDCFLQLYSPVVANVQFCRAYSWPYYRL